MGRMLPMYCKHENVIDWGDFGPGDDIEPDPCPLCEAGDAPWFDHYRRAITAALQRFGHDVPEISVEDARAVKQATIDEENT